MSVQPQKKQHNIGALYMILNGEVGHLVVTYRSLVSIIADSFSIKILLLYICSCIYTDILNDLTLLTLLISVGVQWWLLGWRNGCNILATYVQLLFTSGQVSATAT